MEMATEACSEPSSWPATTTTSRSEKVKNKKFVMDDSDERNILKLLYKGVKLVIILGPCESKNQYTLTQS